MPGAQLVAQPGIGAVGTPLPQTTNPPASQQGPFIRFARKASRPGYQVNGLAFGSSITQPLQSAPGYLRFLKITIQASGGSGATTPAVLKADAPYNIIQNLVFKDPWGTPVNITDGFKLGRIINPFSGQAGLLNAASLANLPSWAAVDAGGNFKLSFKLPIEANVGYGVMSIGNSSVLPTLNMILAAAAQVYSTLPVPTLPTITVTVDEFYYDVDPQNPVEPPGNGSSLQWVSGQGAVNISSGGAQRVQLPHAGGYLTTVGLEFRDSTGALTDQPFTGGGRLMLYIDGIPQWDMSWDEYQDSLFEQFPGVTRPTGVLIFSFKESISQMNLGLLDSYEEVMQTTPGTNLEIQMSPWGTITNSPVQITATYGQIVPAGPLITGLEEL